MINRQQLCSFKFSALMKTVYLQIGKQRVINSKQYTSPISKISLLSSNDNSVIDDKENNDEGDINKDASIHLKIIPKYSDLTITLVNCNGNMCIRNSNFNELAINLTNSSINFKEKIMKTSSNLSLNLNQSKISIESIDSLNYLSINANTNSAIDIKSLSANYFKADVGGSSNIFKCYLMKIKENSILNYSNDTKMAFNINPLALWTLINVYCINQKKFMNLPLGVLGGKIGSTSFPTLILFNKDRPATQLIETLREPVLNISKSRLKLGLIMLGLSIFGIYQAYPHYRFSNELFTRYKMNQYKLKKTML